MSFDPALEHEGLSPSAGPSGKGNMNLDSHLSSMRSSAPELQFGDDTLASAADSPQHHHDTASILHQAAAAAAAESPGQHGGHNLGHVNGNEHDHLNPHLEALKDGDKAQPFSRSPELRVSHKLAERKRRKEMRDMFEELRVMLPTERGSKWSKWEILSKGIDYLEGLKKHNTQLMSENERLRKKVEDVLNYQGGTVGTAAQIDNTTVNANPTEVTSNEYDQFGNYALMGSGDAGSGVLDANLHGGHGHDEKRNSPPLDTDAIRESLTQVGDRVDDMA